MDATTDTKLCRFCGETIKAAAIKCRYCAERLDHGSAGSPGTAAGGALPLATGEERELWGGTGAQWLNLGYYVLAVVAACAGITAVVMTEGTALTVVAAVLFVAAGISALKAYLDVAYRRYSVTTRRIQVESGWLSKRVDQIDVMRIRDVELRQGILQRLLGIGHIHVIARDASDPRFTLQGIPQPRHVYDVIQKQALETVRSRGHVQVNT